MLQNPCEGLISLPTFSANSQSDLDRSKLNMQQNTSGCSGTKVKVCNHVIAVYSENKLQHYAYVYRNHKSAGEKLCLISNLYFSSKPG